MEGRLIGVGVGPGDPELLTLAAVRAIRESDCILLPNEKKEECYAYKIVRQVVPEIEEKEICPMQFPMTKDADVLRAAQDRCFAEVQARMRRERRLYFLRSVIQVCTRPIIIFTGECLRRGCLRR